MIKSFRSSELENFWTRSDDIEAIPTEMTGKIGQVLDLLDAAASPHHVSIPGLRLSSIEEDGVTRHAVIVYPNWRISFGWEGEYSIEVDLEQLQ